LRGNALFGPETARTEARGFTDYFEDLSYLKVGGGILASVNLPAGPALRWFYFGHGLKTGNVYFAIVTPHLDPAQEGPFWERIPGLGSISAVIGAKAYSPSAGQRFVAFLGWQKDEESGKRKLMIARYDLNHGTWQKEPEELTPASRPSIDLGII